MVGSRLVTQILTPSPRPVGKQTLPGNSEVCFDFNWDSKFLFVVAFICVFVGTKKREHKMHIYIEGSCVERPLLIQATALRGRSQIKNLGGGGICPPCLTLATVLQ